MPCLRSSDSQRILAIFEHFLVFLIEAVLEGALVPPTDAVESCSVIEVLFTATELISSSLVLGVS